MEPQKPFNDAVEHLQKIEGFPTQIDTQGRPKFLRYFVYFIIGIFVISFLFASISVFM